VRGEMEVVGLKPFPRLGGGLVEIAFAVKNQKDETVMSGKWVILMRSKPAE
jgi:acyl dehydratase